MLKKTILFFIVLFFCAANAYALRPVPAGLKLNSKSDRPGPASTRIFASRAFKVMPRPDGKAFLHRRPMWHMFYLCYLLERHCGIVFSFEFAESKYINSGGRVKKFEAETINWMLLNDLSYWARFLLVDNLRVHAEFRNNHNGNAKKVFLEKALKILYSMLIDPAIQQEHPGMIIYENGKPKLIKKHFVIIGADRHEEAVYFNKYIEAILALETEIKSNSMPSTLPSRADFNQRTNDTIASCA